MVTYMDDNKLQTLDDIRRFLDGTVMFDPATYKRPQCRISTVFSASGPTMFPGVSIKDRIDVTFL